jgi:hypothetical protein
MGYKQDGCRNAALVPLVFSRHMQPCTEMDSTLLNCALFWNHPSLSRYTLLTVPSLWSLPAKACLWSCPAGNIYGVIPSLLSSYFSPCNETLSDALNLWNKRTSIQVRYQNFSLGEGGWPRGYIYIYFIFYFKNHFEAFHTVHSYSHSLLSYQLNAHSMLNKYIYHRLPPTCLHVSVFVTPSSGWPSYDVTNIEISRRW